MNRADFITGERIQELCDVYCGLAEDFCYNPRILAQPEKHLDLTGPAPAVWNNPTRVFCYSHRLREFRRWLAVATRPFTLITHNSDENITGSYADLCDHPLIVAIYSQNVLYDHPKLFCLPIGIANSMWAHGNLDTLKAVMDARISKTRDVYFYFGVGTNRAERSLCRQICEEKGLTFGNGQSHSDYLMSLASYKYAICPVGNGVDSHRLWECLYLGVTPIVVRNIFNAKFAAAFPCVLLDSWEDLDMDALTRSWKPFEQPDALRLSHVGNCLFASKNIWCIHS
jgi:hypothetical protein